MNNARTIQIPLDHLSAELIAFPLASTAAFSGAIRDLDPSLGGANGRLWRDAERYFVSHFPHVSLDELISLRNRTWFDPERDGSCPLDEYLRTQAHAMLRAPGRRRGAV